MDQLRAAIMLREAVALYQLMAFYRLPQLSPRWRDPYFHTTTSLQRLVLYFHFAPSSLLR